jgi:hypothetical protein
MLTARPAWMEAEQTAVWMRRRPEVPRLAAPPRYVLAAERPLPLALPAVSRSGQQLAPRWLAAQAARPERSQQAA